MSIYKQPVNAHIKNLSQDKSVEALEPNWIVFITNSHQTKHQGNVYETTTQLQAIPILVNTKLNLFANPRSKSKMVVHYITLKKGYCYLNTPRKNVFLLICQNNLALIPTKNIQACCGPSFSEAGEL
jgi:hypothetical protein